VVERVEIQATAEQEDLEEVRRVDSREQEDLEQLGKDSLEELQTVVSPLSAAAGVVLAGLHPQSLLAQARFHQLLERHTLVAVVAVELQMRHMEEPRMVQQVERVAGVLAVDILELVFLQRLEQQIRVVVVAEERITQLAVTRATTNLVQQVGRVWL
jgi:hypothetical protein